MFVITAIITIILAAVFAVITAVVAGVVALSVRLRDLIPHKSFFASYLHPKQNSELL